MCDPRAIFACVTGQSTLTCCQTPQLCSKYCNRIVACPRSRQPIPQQELWGSATASPPPPQAMFGVKPPAETPENVSLQRKQRSPGLRVRAAAAAETERSRAAVRSHVVGAPRAASLPIPEMPRPLTLGFRYMDVAVDTDREDQENSPLLKHGQMTPPGMGDCEPKVPVAVQRRRSHRRSRKSGSRRSKGRRCSLGLRRLLARASTTTERDREEENVDDVHDLMPGCMPGAGSLADAWCKPGCTPLAPGGGCWDWPLSRLEQKARVLMLDRTVMLLDQEELVAKLQRMQENRSSV